MKNPLLTVVLILAFGLSFCTVSSCNKISENVYSANALVGVWRLAGTTVDVTVDGIDLVQYLVESFGYTEDEAKDMKDDVVDDFFNNYMTSITFYGDKTYTAVMNNSDEGDGTWTVSADGKTLSLILVGEEKDLAVLEQTSSTLKVQLPAEYKDYDFDSDGVNESAVEANIEQDLTKNSRGGMGQ